VRTCEQKVKKGEKLTLRFHRNLLILLGKLPLRQIISKEFQWHVAEWLAGFGASGSAFQPNVLGPHRVQPSCGLL
jgi:hypothetical protein